LDGGRQIVLEVLGWGIVIAAAVQKEQPAAESELASSYWAALVGPVACQLQEILRQILLVVACRVQHQKQLQVLLS
jgi:hypothetical protein